MTDAARAARAAYQREWQRRNPDKVRAYQSKYWERKAESEQQDGSSGNAGKKEGDMRE